MHVNEKRVFCPGAAVPSGSRRGHEGLAGWPVLYRAKPTPMNTTPSFVCTALLLVVPAVAQPDRMSLTIVQTEDPVFPRRLQNTAVMSGEARVAIDVDENGKLTDWLVTGYSRKEFADSAVAALRQWRYEPPCLDGQPWSSVRELYFDYTRTGVVVNFTGSEALTSRMDSLTQSAFAYRTYSLRDLDRIPTPIHVVSPLAPAPGSGGGEGKHTVSVEFYIDEGGRVRLPSVTRAEAGSVYAASALAAVRQWRFDPPTIKGQPVLVHVTQEFKFVPKE